MTTQEKLIRREQSLPGLSEYLRNILQSCKIHGVSRQHFYDMKPVRSMGWMGSGKGVAGNHA